MARNFWNVVNGIIHKSDVILVVLDARFVEKTRHAEVENKVLKAGKKLLFVINKCDLVDKKEVEQWKKKLNPLVFMSSTEHLGTTILRKKIMTLLGYKEGVVGVVGYPNVGKSSIINALKGKKAASVSPQSGHTKGVQMVRVSQSLMLLDSPGVIPYKEDDKLKHAEISAVDFSKAKDPDVLVFALMEEHPGLIEDFYGVSGSPEEVLDAIAHKHGKLKKGSETDIEAVSRLILKDWQRGKINIAEKK